MKGFWLLPAALAAPAAVCVGRALAAKPAAANAKIELKNDARAKAYGAKLSQMIRCETVSSRDSRNVDKFLAFHKTLEELFPNVHAACEKHEFDGSLLFNKHPADGYD